MKKIKFVTTFSENGYHVYGQSWIESFLEFTKAYDHITARVYVNGMDLSTLPQSDKIQIVDYDGAIPKHGPWVTAFLESSCHDQWNRDLSIKFSFKSFVMLDMLKNNNKDIVIWLDADSIFTSYDFETFPFDILHGKFLAIQREHGSEHCESGIVIFDTEHTDKNNFLKYFEKQYADSSQYNSYGQFFDGYALYRSIVFSNIDFVDLNDGYGLGGIQSDPDCTFLNPALKSRFYHNIGITGKRNYKRWQDFAKIDPFFQLIHGVNDPVPKTVEEITQENLAKVNAKILFLRRKR